ncbi:RNA polymerase subunit AC19 [Rhizophlyctis rosea]|uniref:RNA polymerase subunit AC19 n=1 Tax=Rhizophlyctis rosea TaxID=64517 RepID=A0AAD5S642_9FUNG|nr:RNA polymerase subunit AC19 [Rhizophlyctis rosea]
MAMVEPTTDTTGVPHTEGEKIEILASDYEDPSVATFSIRDEDHTLGNSLRYMIMKNPAVAFCGYALPHPSEYKINLRIQTDGMFILVSGFLNTRATSSDDYVSGSMTAVEALHKGLDDLMALCDHVTETFDAKLAEREFEIREGAEVDAQ